MFEYTGVIIAKSYQRDASSASYPKCWVKIRSVDCLVPGEFDIPISVDVFENSELTGKRVKITIDIME